ncbi:putative Zn-dependent protease-like protein [Hyella patelloides LEGE 07179]|uniref:Putative Zn-dependent protease-like protein n=1 Tax=Hyella patelloides LEGE 07179 TaxID=945734 RepID=A0A563W129_9CYAN|nr:TldD/PmbA family protein [Hyella patelloides]VEP17381.1 putative Zn-dependent protease-like protein [Hyella patelloides LEGE 07179]
MNHQLEELLNLAQAQGASHSEVYQVQSQSRPVFFEGNRLKQLENSQSTGTALRLWYQGCPGVAVAYGEIKPQILVGKAIAISQLNTPENIDLTPARTEIHPNSGQSLTVEELISIGQDAIAKIRDLYPETICSAEFDCETEATILVNSQGLHCEYTDTTLSYYLGVELVKDEDFLGIYDGEDSKNSLKCDRAIADIEQRLAWAETNTNTPAGKFPVLFTANAATLLWDTVVSALNGKRVRENSSPWSSYQDKMVASPLLTISQKPEREPYSCPFDDEGTPTKTLNLITAGQLNNFYCDRTIAKELGIPPTGNGFRPDLGSYPTPSLTNLIVEPGDSSLTQLIAQLDNGIIVDQILGGGADISGDFSVNVELGYRVSGGEVVGRIKDTAISGNVYNIIQQIVTLGNDVLWNGSCNTPSLIVEGLSVVS